MSELFDARYICVECDQGETGESDCLKHADKYGHKEFRDTENGEIYEPYADPELFDD